MRANRTLAGILFLMVGIAIFSVQDVILKQISDRYPLSQAMTIRSVVAMPLMLLIVRLSDGRLSTLFTPGTVKMILRGLLNFLAYTAYYLGLAVLPIATTVALFFAAPLFISLLAPLLLRERAIPGALPAVVAGFLGVLMIIGPQGSWADGLGPAAVLPVLGALGYALSMIAARALGRTETAGAMAFWGNLGFLVAALILSAAFGAGQWAETAPPALRFLMLPWVWPDLTDFLRMAACGGIAAAGLTLLTQAYRIAPATSVAPFEYTFIFWGVLWGWLFWGELPVASGWVGIAVIVAAGLWVIWAEARAAAARPGPAPETSPETGPETGPETAR